MVTYENIICTSEAAYSNHDAFVGGSRNLPPPHCLPSHRQARLAVEASEGANVLDLPSFIFVPRVMVVSLTEEVRSRIVSFDKKLKAR